MNDFSQHFRDYSIKYAQKIKAICAPLETELNIPAFTYYQIDKEGNFGYLSNKIEFNEYYFANQFYLENPYYSHPDFFHSGSVIVPCTRDEEKQDTLLKKFKADHLLLTLDHTDTGMEGFIFGSYEFDFEKYASYFSSIPLLKKFQTYFKKEAQQILGKIKSEKFNIKQTCKATFSSVPPAIPLSNTDPKMQRFLKKITKLSKQEQRCLDLFQKGHSAQATAAIMGLSKRTVEFYFENIKSKLGCYSKWELLKY